MTALPFAPPITPSVGTTSKPEVKLHRTEFGDGYSRAQPAGINHVRAVESLRWDVLTRDEKDAINAFLVERGGWQSFRYTVPGTDVSRLYTCDDWQVATVAPSLFSIEATFREAFNA